MNTFKKYLNDGNVFVRKCDNCGSGMMDGYVWADGDGYACSDECLFVDGYTKEQRDEDYEADGIYWTEWEICHHDLDVNSGFYDSKGKFISMTKKELEAFRTEEVKNHWKPKEVA